jgi:general secretion pathway protein C
LRIFTFGVWALAAGSVAFWGLKLSTRPLPSTAAVVAQGGDAATDPLAVARLLGAVQTDATGPVSAPVPSRFSLTGVAAASGQGGQRGVALIAMDGKSPRPYRVGSSLEPGLLLQAVHARQATLGPALDAPATVTLELPVRK